MVTYKPSKPHVNRKMERAQRTYLKDGYAGGGLLLHIDPDDFIIRLVPLT